MASDSKSLIIVESPSKIKTLKKFLGSEYVVEASVGHIRDLAKKDMGVDIDNDFTPTYVVSEDKTKVVKQLKKSAKGADKILLATDPDREGEAISWHILELLKPKVPVQRLVFNEITKTAILDSINNPKEINMNLVHAQESRRILDRLFGFLVSKILWTNVKGKLSAGRVQSPAIKIIIDKERERLQFVENSYCSITATLGAAKQNFESILISKNDRAIATGSDFVKKTGKLKSDDLIHLNKEYAEKYINQLDILESGGTGRPELEYSRGYCDDDDCLSDLDLSQKISWRRTLAKFARSPKLFFLKIEIRPNRHRQNGGFGLKSYLN